MDLKHSFTLSISDQSTLSLPCSPLTWCFFISVCGSWGKNVKLAYIDYLNNQLEVHLRLNSADFVYTYTTEPRLVILVLWVNSSKWITIIKLVTVWRERAYVFGGDKYNPT